jgi:hypothetical protein
MMSVGGTTVPGYHGGCFDLVLSSVLAIILVKFSNGANPSPCDVSEVSRAQNFTRRRRLVGSRLMCDTE